MSNILRYHKAANNAHSLLYQSVIHLKDLLAEKKGNSFTKIYYSDNHAVVNV